MAKLRRQYLFTEVAATRAFAADIGRRIQPGEVVALVGNLGSGKTTFTQGLAHGLEITAQVGSPTFKIVSEYDAPRLRLYHVDCYRLQDGRDFLNIGGENLLTPSDGIVLIEWADIIEDLLPPEHLRIDFAIPPDNLESRHLVLTGPWDAALSD